MAGPRAFRNPGTTPYFEWDRKAIRGFPNIQRAFDPFIDVLGTSMILEEWMIVGS
jgi:hypothetical protein